MVSHHTLHESDVLEYFTLLVRVTLRVPILLCLQLGKLSILSLIHISDSCNTDMSRNRSKITLENITFYHVGTTVGENKPGLVFNLKSSED